MTSNRQNLNIAYLQPKTKIFVELLLITIILQTQKDLGDVRNEASLMDVFLKPKEMPGMAGSLRYFLKKVVSKSDIARSKPDQETVSWGCKVASNALAVLSSQAVAEG